MPRRRRIYVAGLSVHVMNRGHNKAPIFHEDLDNETFLAILRHATQRFDVHVHGFALMKNHFHMQATPQNETALARAMKEIGQRYAAYYNRKHQTMGSVWNGRYKDVLIEDAHQWLRCLKYIDLNPVRAGVVERPEDYVWTSYRAHAMGTYCSWLVEHPVFMSLAPGARERYALYRSHCRIPFSSAELALQRHPLKLEAEAQIQPRDNVDG